MERVRKRVLREKQGCVLGWCPMKTGMVIKKENLSALQWDRNCHDKCSMSNGLVNAGSFRSSSKGFHIKFQFNKASFITCNFGFSEHITTFLSE